MVQTNADIHWSYMWLIFEYLSRKKAFLEASYSRSRCQFQVTRKLQEHRWGLKERAAAEQPFALFSPVSNSFKYRQSGKKIFSEFYFFVAISPFVLLKIITRMNDTQTVLFIDFLYSRIKISKRGRVMGITSQLESAQ